MRRVDVHENSLEVADYGLVYESSTNIKAKKTIKVDRITIFQTCQINNL